MSESVRILKTTRYAWVLGDMKVRWNIGAKTAQINTSNPARELNIDVEQIDDLIVLLEEVQKLKAQSEADRDE